MKVLTQKGIGWREGDSNDFMSYLFIAFQVFAVILVFIMFSSWNFSRETDLPSYNGTLKDSEFGVDSCSIGPDNVSIFGWAFPEGAEKFDTKIYIKSSNSDRYFNVKAMLYSRGKETESMKRNGQHDFSGYYAAQHIMINKKDIGVEVEIMALDRNGIYKRGSYVCK